MKNLNKYGRKRLKYNIKKTSIKTVKRTKIKT